MFVLAAHWLPTKFVAGKACRWFAKWKKCITLEVEKSSQTTSMAQLPPQKATDGFQWRKTKHRSELRKLPWHRTTTTTQRRVSGNLVEVCAALRVTLPQARLYGVAPHGDSVAKRCDSSGKEFVRCSFELFVEVLLNTWKYMNTCHIMSLNLKLFIYSGFVVRSGC